MVRVNHNREEHGDIHRHQQRLDAMDGLGGALNSKSFIDFLRRLVKDAKTHSLVLDNLRVQRRWPAEARSS